jgi:hypothetical protein
MLRVAAGLAAILVVGTGAYQLWTHRLTGNDQAASTAAGAADAGGAPILAPILATGTNYTKATLATQVKSLVGESQGAAAYSAGDGSRSSTRETSSAEAVQAADPQAPVPAAAPGGDTQTTLAGKQAAASGDLLRSSTALRACLSAIGEPDAQPVAVDLARYGGRDAAILVLQAANGDYNVWVVARDCAPNKDGTQEYAVIPA